MTQVTHYNTSTILNCASPEELFRTTIFQLMEEEQVAEWFGFVLFFLFVSCGFPFALTGMHWNVI